MLSIQSNVFFSSYSFIYVDVHAFRLKMQDRPCIRPGERVVDWMQIQSERSMRKKEEKANQSRILRFHGLTFHVLSCRQHVIVYIMKTAWVA